MNRVTRMRLRSLFQALSLASILCATLTGCVDVPDEVVLSAAPGVPPAAPAPGLTTGCVEGQATIGRLLGRVYELPVDTRRMPDFAAMPPAGAICLDRLAISERRGPPGFPGVRGRYQWFGVDLQGAFIVQQPGAFHFRLTSDDGARLVIDGAVVIENDGYHTTRAREATVTLGPGPHRIEVPYWQGPGPMALGLEVARPGEPLEIFRVDRPL